MNHNQWVMTDVAFFFLLWLFVLALLVVGCCLFLHDAEIIIIVCFAIAFTIFPHHHKISCQLPSLLSKGEP